MGGPACLRNVFGSITSPDNDMFRYVLVTDDMDGHDGYKLGDELCFKRSVSPQPGNDVLVKIPGGQEIFRRLQKDANGLYLLALKTKTITRLDPGAEICGVVFRSGRVR